MDIGTVGDRIGSLSLIRLQALGVADFCYFDRIVDGLAHKGSSSSMNAIIGAGLSWPVELAINTGLLAYHAAWYGRLNISCEWPRRKRTAICPTAERYQLNVNCAVRSRRNARLRHVCVMSLDAPGTEFHVYP